MKKEPEFIKVKFGDIIPWEKNPRDIKKDDLLNLAQKIEKFGMFKNLVCWKENGSITIGGGNMRYFAMRDVLKFAPDREITISMNYPESEKEKIELSLLDNMIAGVYLEQDLAEMLFPFQSEIDLENYKLPFANPTDLSSFLKSFAPDLPDPNPDPPIEQTSEVMIEVLCSNKDLTDFQDTLDLWAERKGVTINVS